MQEIYLHDVTKLTAIVFTPASRIRPEDAIKRRANELLWITNHSLYVSGCKEQQQCLDSERQGHRSISSCILLVAVVLLLSAPGSSASCYKRIFAFGDSIIDTGNFVYSTGSAPNALKEFPYGMTFFHHPTGRVCDGRVLLDFYAQALGLLLVQPSLPEQRWGQCKFGANFAVFAATALPPEYFKRWGLNIPGSANLGMQMGWFKEVVQAIAPGPGNEINHASMHACMHATLCF